MTLKALVAAACLAATTGAFAGTISFSTASTGGFGVVDRTGTSIPFITNAGYLVPTLTVPEQQASPFSNPTGYWEARTTITLPSTPISNVRLTLTSFAIDDRAGLFFNNQLITAAGLDVLSSGATGSLQRAGSGGTLSTITGVSYIANRDVFNPGPGGVGVNVPGAPVTFTLSNFLPGANELLFVVNDTFAGFRGNTRDDGTLDPADQANLNRNDGFVSVRGSAGPTAMIAIGSISWDTPAPEGQVPVPATLVLLGAGLLGLGALRRRG